MRLIFMGTPEFALPALNTLLASHHEVVAVVTQPDRPKGRGRKLCAPPVKETAVAAGVPVLQPESMKSPDFIQALTRFNADCFVVVAFRILPAAVYSLPLNGTFNLHTSLLPQYRGAAPMQWAIMNGETQTGLTTFLLDRQVDTGDILLQESLDIGPEETLGELHDRMALRGAALVLKTVNGLAAGSLHPRPQQGKPSPAPKIKSWHAELDWTWPVDKIVNRVRALSPRPGAVTLWQGKRLKIYTATSDDFKGDSGSAPGTVLHVSPQGLIVQAGDGCVRISALQMEGRKRMNTDAFLRGCALHQGDSLGNREVHEHL